MSIKVKNLLYQPVAITNNKGLTTILGARQQKVINDLDLNNLPDPVKGLIKKDFIKIREV